MINNKRKAPYISVLAAAALLISTHGIAQESRISSKRAFFYSLLVPGLGQYYVNSKESIKYFAIAEVSMIGAAIGHEAYSNWLEEDYRTFAVRHAGVNPQGKNKHYYVEISKYNSIYIYNEKARINRYPESIIPETPENIWVWDSRDNRLKFHFKRVDADKIGNRAVYYYTGLFVNHLVSGIHAAIIAKRQKSSDSKSNWGFNIRPLSRNRDTGIQLRVRYNF
ncbi:hypothetical protein ACFL6L_01825 [candidate division KSB1 bacterium]